MESWSYELLAVCFNIEHRIRGKLPFTLKSRKELYYDICNVEPEYDIEWTTVSEDCKDFVKKVLVKDPSIRLSAEEALNHPWIAKNRNPRNV